MEVGACNTWGMGGHGKLLCPVIKVAEVAWNFMRAQEGMVGNAILIE
jgi:hypothetical protein